MTSFLASFWCQTIQFPPTSNAAASEEAESLQFGPWYQSAVEIQSTDVGGTPYIFVRDVCVAFPSGTYIDPKLKTVRAFSIIVVVLGGLATFGLWLAPFCPGRHTSSSWKSLAMFYSVILTLFQGLTFLLFSSSFCTNNSIVAALSGSEEYYGTDPKCQWDQGTTCNVVSTVLWFVTGLLMCTIVPAPERPPPEPVQTQTVTYQRTTNPDGTTTVAPVAIVKGTAVTNNNTPPPAQQYHDAETGLEKPDDAA